MTTSIYFRFLPLLLILAIACTPAPAPDADSPTPQSMKELEPARRVMTGAERMDQYLPLIQDQAVALVVNQTSMVGESHLADTLHALGIDIRAIFAPEHGFRGEADAGAKIEDGRDPRTGIPLISLYGSKRQPSAEDLAGVDWVLFDIQDVGARFYTYISTMHYVMEACAAYEVPFMVLDRPNPNGHYVDGPIRLPEYQSFVAMDPIPVVHGVEYLSDF